MLVIQYNSSSNKRISPLRFFSDRLPSTDHSSLPSLPFLKGANPHSLPLWSQCPQISYQYLLQCMNCLRELPSEYIDLCPTIDQKYRVLFKLGQGRFSQVKLAINLATNQRVAIKLMNHRIDEASLDRPQEQKVMELFLNEVRMASMARHRNVVQIIDFNVGGLYRTADGKTQRILYYVMKIEEYGELFRVISLTEQFSEKTARYIFRQVLSALRGLHGKRIAHCDIKSENLLLDSKFNVKIVDFGYARHFVDELCQPIEYESSDAVGSLKSNAPELVANGGKGVYQADEIDVFAVGCFLFQLVLKAQPFKSADMKDQHYSRLAGMDKKKFWQIFSSKLPPSAQFKDLVENMLNPNPKERISLQAVMKHPWTNGETPGREDYKKEMGVRVKKVMVKVRKEQQLEMKQAFMKEKGKREEGAERFDFQMRRELEEEIMQLRSMIVRDDTGSSVSDASVSEREEGGCKLQERNSGGMEREGPIRQ